MKLHCGGGVVVRTVQTLAIACQILVILRLQFQGNAKIARRTVEAARLQVGIAAQFARIGIVGVDIQRTGAGGFRPHQVTALHLVQAEGDKHHLRHFHFQGLPCQGHGVLMLSGR